MNHLINKFKDANIKTSMKTYKQKSVLGYEIFGPF